MRLTIIFREKTSVELDIEPDRFKTLAHDIEYALCHGTMLCIDGVWINPQHIQYFFGEINE